MKLSSEEFIQMLEEMETWKPSRQKPVFLGLHAIYSTIEKAEYNNKIDLEIAKDLKELIVGIEEIIDWERQ
jgi:hypothetical protein